MLPKDIEDNPLAGTTIGSTQRLHLDMDPGHNGLHAKEQKKVIVKALYDPILTQILW